MEIVPYGGWTRCARLASDGIELIATLDVGPRVIRFGFEGEPNVFRENPAQLGLRGGDTYRGYGGHRLWVAPEDPVRTMQPDNDPVECEEAEGWLVLRSATDRFGIQKEIGIRIEGGAARLRHRIHNRGGGEDVLAPWALSVMAAGGECLFPHEPHQPHPERLLPTRPLVLWSYTEMSDPRWTWGPGVIRLRHTDGGPQKVGALVTAGIAVYTNAGTTFVKRFPYDEGATYPDMGCNFETFTRHDMLEVESLGPLKTLSHGRYAEHWETWYLVRGEAPADGREAASWLGDVDSNHPLRVPL